MIRTELEEAIGKALSGIGASDVSFSIDYPPAETGADYATNAALVAANALRKSPREVAELLATNLQSQNISQVEKIGIADAGFVNFFLTHEALVQEIEKAATDARWGKNDLYRGKTIMVEYTDPNPFKEFHIGHLMSNAIGESIARLLEFSGADVKRANYQGDVGVHVAKAIYALLQMADDPLTIGKLGISYAAGNELYEEHKEEIDEVNRKIYDKSDDKINKLYAEGRKLSLERFDVLYKILGTKFDFFFFESETGPIGLKLVQAHPEVFEKSDGALVFKGEKYGLHTRVFVTSKGIPTYEAKELGLVEAKKEKGTFDLSLVVTANEISEYFKVVRKAAECIDPDLAGRIEARFHGFMRLTTGKMSSRTGNIITGESLLGDLIVLIHRKMQGRQLPNVNEIANQVAVGAIKYTVLRQGSGKDIVFDPEKSLSLEGDSGPYIQYAHTRCVSILRKASAEGVEPKWVTRQGVALAQGSQGDTFPLEPKGDSLALEGVSLRLAQLVLRFPEIVTRAATEYEPHYVTQYLIELAAEFNSFYAREKVLDGTDAAPAKLALVSAVRQTLKNGLWVLGIEAPDEM